MDKIIIRDFTVAAVIGTFPEERQRRRPLLINLELSCDLAPAGRSDRLEDTVDYYALREKIAALVETSEFFLIERLAQAVAELCLAEPRVARVAVTVDKPDALSSCRSVAVAIERCRNVG
ncbi:MAG: dihydroneopterin aldolase [Victivallales bacterium]|nr:dihydroneopterin aldolase [Victivallales bacterium]